MTISHQLKLIFIHVHRTGGTTINNLLKQAIGSELEIRGEHVNLEEIGEQVSELQKEYFVFSFVRNPWERILSWYFLLNSWNLQDISIERQKFQEFLEFDLAFAQGDNFFHYNQLDYFPEQKGSINSIKLYRFENFQDEVRELFQFLELPLKEIPIINNTTQKRYQDYYTKKSIELINEKCSTDIEHFGYTF